MGVIPHESMGCYILLSIRMTSCTPCRTELAIDCLVFELYN